MPLPVILDTDIGTDIDDAYALVLAAVSPELDLRAVTTVNHDVALRGRIAKALLGLLGRDDVPVALGARESLTPGEARGWLGHEGRGIALDGVAPARDFDPRPAPRLIADAAQAAHAAGRPLTLLTIGALTNAALALRDYPEATARLGGIVAMAACFDGWGPENARVEHNVACDPVAADLVLRSGLPVTLIGLNVTQQTAMTAADVKEMAACGGPLAEALAGMHRVWFEQIRADRSSMHDGLAVAAAFRPELVTLTPVLPHVQCAAPDTGAIVYNPPLPGQVTACRIAVSVDADAFHALLRERITRAVNHASE